MGNNEVNSFAPLTYIWTIENYPQLDYDGKVLSPKFTAYSMEGTQWYVEVNTLYCMDLFECALWRVDDREPQSIEIDFEFSILAANGTALIQRKKTGTFKKETCVRVVEFKNIRLFSRRTEFLPRNCLTFRCRMWKKATKISITDLYFANSRLGTKYKSFIWIIKNFSILKLQEEISRMLEFTLDGIILHFKLSLFFTEADNGKCMWLKIIDTDASREFHLSLEMSLVEVDGKIRISEKRSQYMGGQRSKEIIARIFPKSILESSHFLQFDALCLKCEFEIGTGVTWNGIEPLKSNISQSSITLSDTVPKRDYSDKNTNSTTGQKEEESSLHVNFQSDSQAPPTHKNIPNPPKLPLKEVLVGDLKDRSDKKDTFRLLIRYIYTDIIPDLDWESALDLFKAAIKYKLSGLRKACCMFLEENMSLSNFGDVIKLVYAYSEDDFRGAVERFFSKHDIQILNSGVWKTLKQDNPREILEILERVYIRKIKIFEMSL